MAALGVTSGTAKVYEVRVLASIPVAMAEESTKGRKKGRGRLVRRSIFGLGEGKAKRKTREKRKRNLRVTTWNCKRRRGRGEGGGSV